MLITEYGGGLKHPYIDFWSSTGIINCVCDLCVHECTCVYMWCTCVYVVYIMCVLLLSARQHNFEDKTRVRVINTVKIRVRVRIPYK